MINLTQVIEEIRQSFPQGINQLHDFDLETKQGALRDFPKYLFRGENRVHVTTFSSFGRKKDKLKEMLPEINHWVNGNNSVMQTNLYSLKYFLREALFKISVADTEYNNSLMDCSLAAAMQHYGFDTSFIDLTADLMVAAHFATSGATAGDIVSIMVMKTEKFDCQVFDLTREDAVRPRRQSGYALLLPDNLDMRSKSFLDEYNTQWLIAVVNDEDIRLYNKPELLSLEDDVYALHIIDWFEAHIENNLDITSSVKEYFKNKVDCLKIK